ncbi:MAG: FAD-binding oxidoreductase [bacterium]|nr:FAD-binding oxidoreductase [bacterium]
MDTVLCEAIRLSGCQLVERLLPRMVAVPQDEAAISNLIQVAAEKRKRICSTGTGSSFAANYQPPDDMIFLLMVGMNQLLEIRPMDAIVVVEAGLLTTNLAQQMAGSDLDFPAVLADYPGTIAGAVLGPDHGGLRHAEIRRRLLGLELIDSEGRALRFGSSAIKNVAGFDYWSFIIGSAGRFGVVTRLTLNIEKMLPLTDIPNLKTAQNSDPNPVQWIYANLCKDIDPHGIFAR